MSCGFVEVCAEDLASVGHFTRVRPSEGGDTDGFIAAADAHPVLQWFQGDGDASTERQLWLAALKELPGGS